MAHIYRLKRRPQDAARELREGLKLAPNDARLNAELGYLMLDQGRAPQAAERFRAAVLLDSANTDAWVGLVTALRRSGHGVQADRVLARAPVAVRSLVTNVRADTAVYVPPVVDSTGATLAPAPGAAPTSAYPPDTTGTVAVPPPASP
jgi:tetratricopeptide (TPR) repeat protein